MLPALHGREGKLRQPTVVSLNTLRLLLHLQPRAALGAADSPAEVLGAVLGVVRQSAAAFKVRARVRVRVRARVRVTLARTLTLNPDQEDAPKSAMWLVTNGWSPYGEQPFVSCLETSLLVGPPEERNLYICWFSDNSIILCNNLSNSFPPVVLSKKPNAIYF